MRPPLRTLAVAGSDEAGDGSPSAPWATIRHALGEVPDGATVLVGPGTYSGQQRLEGHFDPPVTVRAAVAYQARLRHSATVVIAYDASGIRFEGFDVAHAGPGAGALVMQVKNPGTRAIEIRDNVFFNDFAGSGRVGDGSTSSYVVVKDSNEGDFHWEGSAGSNFVLFGEDGKGLLRDRRRLGREQPSATPRTRSARRSASRARAGSCSATTPSWATCRATPSRCA